MVLEESTSSIRYNKLNKAHDVCRIFQCEGGLKNFEKEIGDKSCRQEDFACNDKIEQAICAQKNELGVIEDRLREEFYSGNICGESFADRI